MVKLQQGLVAYVVFLALTTFSSINLFLEVESYRHAGPSSISPRQAARLSSPQALHAVLNLRQAADIVREKVILSQIVGNYVDIRSYGGASFQCLCPFHDDRNPSMSVTDDKGLFYCHACSTGGDVFKFVESMEKCGFKNAVEHIISLAGLDIEIDSSSDSEAGRQSQYRNRRILDALSKAAKFYSSRMYDPGAGAARRHLISRRILPQTAVKFQIGFAPQTYFSRDKGTSSLFTNLTAEGFSPPELVSAGLAIDKSPYQQQNDDEKHSSDGIDPAYASQQLGSTQLDPASTAAPARDVFYDRFRGRLMVPIRDEYGNVIAFGGRILEEEGGSSSNNKQKQSGGYADNKSVGAKYINSPETEVFKKGSNLFGLDLAKRAIARDGEVIIVEGYFDVISLHDVGVENSVAALGTALTKQQLDTASRWASSGSSGGGASTANKDSPSSTSSSATSGGGGKKPVAPVKRPVGKVVLLLDDDAAGRQAVLRVCEKIIPYGLSHPADIRIATFSHSLDDHFASITDEEDDDEDDDEEEEEDDEDDNEEDEGEDDDEEMEQEGNGNEIYSDTPDKTRAQGGKKGEKVTKKVAKTVAKKVTKKKEKERPPSPSPKDASDLCTWVNDREASYKAIRRAVDNSVGWQQWMVDRLILAGCGLIEADEPAPDATSTSPPGYSDDDYDNSPSSSTGTSTRTSSRNNKSFGKNAAARIVNSDPAIFSSVVTSVCKFIRSLALTTDRTILSIYVADRLSGGHDTLRAQLETDILGMVNSAKPSPPPTGTWSSSSSRSTTIAPSAGYTSGAPAKKKPDQPAAVLLRSQTTQARLPSVAYEPPTGPAESPAYETYPQPVRPPSYTRPQTTTGGSVSPSSSDVTTDNVSINTASTQRHVPQQAAPRWGQQLPPQQQQQPRQGPPRQYSWEKRRLLEAKKEEVSFASRVPKEIQQVAIDLNTPDDPGEALPRDESAAGSVDIEVVLEVQAAPLTRGTRGRRGGGSGSDIGTDGSSNSLTKTSTKYAASALWEDLGPAFYRPSVPLANKDVAITTRGSIRRGSMGPSDGFTTVTSRTKVASPAQPMSSAQLLSLDATVNRMEESELLLLSAYCHLPLLRSMIEGIVDSIAKLSPKLPVDTGSVVRRDSDEEEEKEEEGGRENASPDLLAQFQQTVWVRGDHLKLWTLMRVLQMREEGMLSLGTKAAAAAGGGGGGGSASGDLGQVEDYSSEEDILVSEEEEEEDAESIDSEVLSDDDEQVQLQKVKGNEKTTSRHSSDSPVKDKMRRGPWGPRQLESLLVDDFSDFFIDQLFSNALQTIIEGKSVLQKSNRVLECALQETRDMLAAYHVRNEQTRVLMKLNIEMERCQQQEAEEEEARRRELEEEEQQRKVENTVVEPANTAATDSMLSEEDDNETMNHDSRISEEISYQQEVVPIMAVDTDAITLAGSSTQQAPSSVAIKPLTMKGIDPALLAAIDVAERLASSLSERRAQVAAGEDSTLWSQFALGERRDKLTKGLDQMLLRKSGKSGGKNAQEGEWSEDDEEVSIDDVDVADAGAEVLYCISGNNQSGDDGKEAAAAAVAEADREKDAGEKNPYDFEFGEADAYAVLADGELLEEEQLLLDSRNQAPPAEGEIQAITYGLDDLYDDSYKPIAGKWRTSNNKGVGEGGSAGGGAAAAAARKKKKTERVESEWFGTYFHKDGQGGSK